MKFLRSQSCKRYRPWNFPVMIFFLKKCKSLSCFSHFCKKKSWQESFKGDISCNFENEEISSEVLRVEAFNSKNLWWNFFVLKVAREIVTGKNIFYKNFVKFLVVTQKITLHISDKKNGRFLSENMKYTSRDKKKYFHISTLVFYID